MNNKIELKKIIIKNICQHVKTDFFLSDKLTLILAGNGTGKSILTESIGLKPNSKSHSNKNMNLLTFWSNDENNKSEIIFEYLNKDEKMETNSLVMDENRHLKWSQDHNNLPKPNIEFFNENYSYKSSLRNIEGRDLLNLSKEIQLATIGEKIISRFENFEKYINDYNQESMKNNNDDSLKSIAIKTKDAANIFLEMFAKINLDKSHLQDLSREYKVIFVYYFNAIKLDLFFKNYQVKDYMMALKKVEKHFSLQQEFLFLMKNDALFNKTKMHKYDSLIDQIKEGDINDVAKQIKDFKINASNLHLLLEKFFTFSKNYSQNESKGAGLSTGITHLHIYFEAQRELYRFYNHEQLINGHQKMYEFLEHFDENFEDKIASIKTKCLEYRKISDMYKQETKEKINKMLDNTFLKNKIVINDDLYITSFNDKKIRTSTAEFKLIIFKYYLIEILRTKKSIDLLILDDITSSMDYQFIDLIYKEISDFINEYRVNNPNFKVIFLTHWDAVFNYFLSKESKKNNIMMAKHKGKSNDIFHYHMFQSNEKKRVIMKQIDYLKVKDFNYKNILTLLNFIYDDNIPNEIKLPLIRKIMECLAIVMNGSNELSNFLKIDKKINKYYFNTILGRISISYHAYEMLNNEAHFDIYDQQSIESTIKIKRDELIKEFIDIFTKQLKFPAKSEDKINKNFYSK